MQDFVGILNQYAAIVSALSTAVIAVLTAVLWTENRRLRKAGSQPEVVGYFALNSEGNGAVNFAIANVGTGPAFDLKFLIEHDEEDFQTHDAMLSNDPGRAPISVLPQGEKQVALFGVGYRLFGKTEEQSIGPLKRFTIKFDYKDSNGRKKKSRSVLDITQFSGISGIGGKPNDARIAESLEKIERHFAEIAPKAAGYWALIDSTQISDTHKQVKKGEE